MRTFSFSPESEREHRLIYGSDGGINTPKPATEQKETQGKTPNETPKIKNKEDVTNAAKEAVKEAGNTTKWFEDWAAAIKKNGGIIAGTFEWLSNMLSGKKENETQEEQKTNKVDKDKMVYDPSRGAFFNPSAWVKKDRNDKTPSTDPKNIDKKADSPAPDSGPTKTPDTASPKPREVARAKLEAKLKKFADTATQFENLKYWGINNAGERKIRAYILSKRKSLKVDENATPRQIADAYKELLEDENGFGAPSETLKGMIRMIVDRAARKLDPEAELNIHQRILENARNKAIRYIDDLSVYRKGRPTAVSESEATMMKRDLMIALNDAADWEKNDPNEQSYNLTQRMLQKWKANVNKLREGYGRQGRADGRNQLSGTMMKQYMLMAIDNAWENRGTSRGSNSYSGVPSSRPSQVTRSKPGESPEYREGIEGYVQGQGGAEFMKRQDKLKENYADREDPKKMKKELEDMKNSLGSDPTSEVQKEKLEKLQTAFDNAQKQWKDNPDRRYGDQAFVRSQTEYARKALDKQKIASEIADEPTIGEPEIIDLGKYAYRSVQIDLPDGGNITFKPYKFDTFERWADAEVAKEQGVYIQVERWGDGRPRKVRVEFKKEGLFSVAGKQVAVGQKGNRDLLDRREKLDMPVLKTQGINEKDSRWGKMRVLDIRPNEGDMIRVDTRALKNGEAFYGPDGMTVTRGNDGKLSVNYRENGTFQVVGRWGMDRQKFIGNVEL